MLSYLLQNTEVIKPDILLSNKSFNSLSNTTRFIQKGHYMFQSQPTTTELPYNMYKRCKYNTYKFIFPVLLCGFPHDHIYDNDEVVKLFGQSAAEWHRGFATFDYVYILM